MMPTSLRYLILSVAVLASLGCAWSLLGDEKTESAPDPGRRPSVEEWTDLGYELEEAVPARALLGGIRNTLLDEKLREKGYSWSGFRNVGRDLLGRASAQQASRRSIEVSSEAISYFSLPQGMKPQSTQGRAAEAPGLDADTESLVLRLILRLPAES